MTEVALKNPNHNEADVAGTRCAARSYVLGRAHTSGMSAPCVLASHSRIAPRRRASL